MLAYHSDRRPESKEIWHRVNAALEGGAAHAPEAMRA